MILNLALGQNSYDIVIERGSIKQAGELLNLNRKTLIVTDRRYPKARAAKALKRFKYCFPKCFPKALRGATAP